jgi:hypothetical protein
MKAYVSFRVEETVYKDAEGYEEECLKGEMEVRYGNEPQAVDDIPFLSVHKENMRAFIDRWDFEEVTETELKFLIAILHRNHDQVYEGDIRPHEEWFIDWWLEKYHDTSLQEVIELHPEWMAEKEKHTRDFYKSYQCTDEQAEEWHLWALEMVSWLLMVDREEARRQFVWTFLNVSPMTKTK